MKKKKSWKKPIGILAILLLLGILAVGGDALLNKQNPARASLSAWDQRALAELEMAYRADGTDAGQTF